MEGDDLVRRVSEEFARKNKKNIAKRRTDPSRFPPEKEPVSVFMAGSPGAGKTEASKNLMQIITGSEGVLRIDPDEIREEFKAYNGRNSSLFQYATSIIADKMQDLAIDRGQSYIFDGTLSNLEAARKNIQRGLDHGRSIFIVYVYQDPEQAWRFVKARERKDGRTIPKEAFIDQYFRARSNVNCLKQEFGKQVMIYLVVKNIDGTDTNYHQNIEKIDNHIPERYSKEHLDALIIE